MVICRNRGWEGCFLDKVNSQTSDMYCFSCRGTLMTVQLLVAQVPLTVSGLVSYL